MLPSLYESIYIQSFKHDGSLHRTWSAKPMAENGSPVNRRFVSSIRINGIM